MKENSIYWLLGTGNYANYLHIYYLVMTDNAVRGYFIYFPFSDEQSKAQITDITFQSEYLFRTLPEICWVPRSPPLSAFLPWSQSLAWKFI